MIYYLYVFVILFVLIPYKQLEKIKISIFFLIGLIFLLIIKKDSLDYLNYKFLLSNPELTNNYFIKIFHYFPYNDKLFPITVLIFSYIVHLFVFKKFLPTYWNFAFAIYISNDLVNKDLIQLKASIASTFALFALYFLSIKKDTDTILNKNLDKLLSFFSFVGHPSSFFITLVHWFYRFKTSVLIFAFLIIVIMSQEIKFDNYFLNYVSTKVSLYLRWGKYNPDFVFPLTSLLFVFIIILPNKYYVIKNEFENLEIINLIKFYLFFGVLCFLFFYPNLVLSIRFLTIHNFGIPILIISLIGGNFNQKYIKIPLLVLLSLYLFFIIKPRADEFIF